ncbi:MULTISPECIES: insecticidal delta-endotoxin Cry8Ea1 family protein [Bacillus cereus group]
MNSNEHDYLKVCDDLSETNMERFDKNDALEIGMSIVSELLGMIPGGAALQFVFNQLWSRLGDSGWSAFMEHVEELIDTKIEGYAKNKALSELAGMHRNLETYIKLLNEWENNTGSSKAQGRVANYFESLEQAVERGMPQFAVGNFEIPLLTVYVQAANLHLLLLRDVSVYGKRWGWSDQKIKIYYEKQVKYTHEYTNHCSTWYNRGLDKLKNKGSSYQDWYNYNRFRREITLTVLDIVAVFPHYDVKAYPIQTVGQLTREVYTDPLINFNPQLDSVSQLPTFSDMENATIRTPHLMEFLRMLTIYTDWYSVGRNYYWGGHRVTSYRVGGENITSPLYGSEANQELPRQLYFYGPVFRTLSNPTLRYLQQPAPAPPFALRRLEGVEFHTTTGTDMYRERGSVDSFNELPPFNPVGLPRNAYSHRLCHATFVRKSGTPYLITGTVFSWTHRSAEETNTIDSNRITQIPLVKAYQISSGTTVRRGPGFTGGDILRRTGPGTFGDIKLNINSPLSQRYRVRIRYASTTDLQFFTNINGTTINMGNFPKTVNNSSSEGYRTVSFSTPFSFSNAQSIFRLGIQAFSGVHEIHVDRIEFVPAEVTFEAEYDLERAQKAVNALFTSTNPKDMKTYVTESQIDQVFNLVECLSDEVCLDEKRELFKKVKYAKQLNIERNM